MKTTRKLLLMVCLLALAAFLPALAKGEALPLDCVITVNKDSVNLGEPVTATWLITGGTPPYTITSKRFQSEGYAFLAVRCCTTQKPGYPR